MLIAMNWRSWISKRYPHTPACLRVRFWVMVLLPCFLVSNAHATNTAYSESNSVQLSVPKPSETEPVLIEANHMGYDEKRQIVLAEGAVEVVQGDYILHAQTLTYFQAQNIVNAEGEVSVLQPNGEVYFADKVELTGDIKAGIISQFRARLSDGSIFAANTATRVNPALTKMQDAVYSPCKICTGEDPFWQLKARKVKVDNIEEIVSYRDAILEFSGVPIIYTPYFEHPTPDAGPVDGITTPDYTQDSNLGTVVRIPYYIRLAPDKEITLTPWYTSEDGFLLQSKYNQLTDGGSLTLESSSTYPRRRDDNGQQLDDNVFRGHVVADGVQDITDYSRLGFNIERSSDDTYLRRYGFGSQFSLTSRAYAEAAQGRNNAVAEAILFQGLRITDDPSTTPQILPSLSGYYETDPLAQGARLHVAGNFQNLARPEGSEYQRAIVSTGASIPYVSDGGHVFEAEANVRGDLYSISDQTLTDSTGATRKFDGQKTRAIPQAALSWRYPLITQIDDASLTLEPVALGVAQPRGGNISEIPNEDNRVVELTDTNIFSTNRNPGYDTIDSGSRVAYGFRSQAQFNGGQSVEGLFGQSYNEDDTPFPNARRAGERFSDYVGRVGFGYAPVNLTYRFALDRQEFALKRNEISAEYSDDRVQLTGIYLNIQDSPYVSDSEEALAYGRLKLDEEWSIYGNGRRDLQENRMISSTGGVLFQNECFSVLSEMQRTFTRDRDLEPSTQFNFRVGFKNFGEFGNE